MERLRCEDVEREVAQGRESCGCAFLEEPREALGTTRAGPWCTVLPAGCQSGELLAVFLPVLCPFGDLTLPDPSLRPADARGYDRGKHLPEIIPSSWLRMNFRAESVSELAEKLRFFLAKATLAGEEATALRCFREEDGTAMARCFQPRALWKGQASKQEWMPIMLNFKPYLNQMQRLLPICHGRAERK